MTSKEFTVSAEQIDCMKHCIGFVDSRVTGRKNRKMEAYRNYYTTSSAKEKLDKLVAQGLMECRDFPMGVGRDPKCYIVTVAGFQFLSQITGIEITEMR